MTPSQGRGQLDGPGTEEDPTGIRDLLRTLPDPGPMPEDLVDRISALLDAEQERRREADAAPEVPVVDLATRRSRRRPGRTLAYLGAAAAGLLVATVAVGELVGDGLLGGTGGMDSAAQVSTHSRGAADSGGSRNGAAADGSAEQDGYAAAGEDGSAADSAAEDAGDQTESAAGGAASPDPVLEVLPPLGELSSASVRQDLLGALDRDLSTTSGAATLTQDGAERCWQEAGVGQGWPVRQAAEAVYGADPVVVLLGRDGPSGAAVLLPSSCTRGVSVEPLEQLAWGR